MMPSDASPATDARPWWRVRCGLVVALLLSIGVHLALSLVPDEPPTTPDSVPLVATIKELPPPPAPSAAPAATPKPKPRAPRPRPPPIEAPAPVAVPESVPNTGDAAPAPQAIAEAPPEVAAEPFGPPALAEDVAPPDLPPPERKALPPRVDLAYKVFYGTQGFHIGSATYRFEHADNRYRIATVGEARGLAALLFRGQGRMESKGLITDSGLQPHEFVVDKFNKRGVERAEFDWETGLATLHDNKTEPLELPTFDPLALMWQFYFQPPNAAQRTFSIATTRRVRKLTIEREREETIDWAHGPIATEVWHRTSDDGKTEAYVWLAPSLRWIPVKMRIVNTTRGTLEALLDAIRVDEAHATAIQ